MNKLIRQKSLAEHIVEDLERRIIAQTLEPGQRIIEESLCKTFGVSRSPVREALQTLESQGFVVREPRKGISVAKITPREAIDIYRIRACLEGLALSLVVLNSTPALLKKLKNLHTQMIRASQEENGKAYSNLNERFHDLIIMACKNERLIQLIRTFDKQTMLYRLAIVNSPGWMTNSTKIHGALITAIEAGDAEAAERIRKKSILGQIQKFPGIFNDSEEEK